MTQDTLFANCTICAPEIVSTEKGYYIAALKSPALDGIQIAPLTWTAK